jgi:hypothetical protein
VTHSNILLWLPQEDFEMAVTKIMKKDSEANESIKKLFK